MWQNAVTSHKIDLWSSSGARSHVTPPYGTMCESYDDAASVIRERRVTSENYCQSAVHNYGVLEPMSRRAKNPTKHELDTKGSVRA